MEFSEVGNTIVMEKAFFERLLEKVSEKATETAIEAYRLEQLKNTEVSVNRASEIIGVDRQSIMRYIHDGKKIGGRKLKLKSRLSGSKYLINRHDLEVFKNQLKP